MAFDVKADGTLGDGRVFFDATAWAKAGQKGLARRHESRSRPATCSPPAPAALHIFSPDGTHLGTLRTGEATANCAWGDDGSTLYIKPTCTWSGSS